jgi:signal transduction histidine kinase
VVPFTLCISVCSSDAIKFSPIGGRIHVQLEASNFIVNPFAAAANLSLLIGDNKYSIHPQPSPPSPPIPHAAAVPPYLDPIYGSGSTPMLSGSGPASSATPIAYQDIPSMPMPLPEILGTLMVRVSVRDAGPGVPAAEAAHLFQAYMQVSAGKTQKGNGTGLGLSISKS